MAGRKKAGEKTFEDKFGEIAEMAIQEAHRVKCPFGDFIDGLELIVEMISERLEQARREAGRED